MIKERGFPVIFDATNVDDLTDYRPGRRAAEESGVVSPFVLSGFTKKDVRLASKKLALESWDKPANPCLASRVPYGTRITEDVLRKIHAGEKFVRALGFPVVRLRHHGQLARLEVPVGDFPRISKPAVARKIGAALRSLGYLWVALDMDGYRTGSLNTALTEKKTRAGEIDRPGKA